MADISPSGIELITDPSQAWRPITRCCWCQREFVQRHVIDRKVWVCPTDACYERCEKWIILDKDGGLFYFPMPKQALLEEAVASQLYGAIMIGGARAGGKSSALRPLAYRYCLRYSNFTVLILRRMFPELLRNHIQKAQREHKRLGAKMANYKVTFPDTDALIEFSHCQDEDDYKQYIGAEFDMVIFDQGEMFTEMQFTEIGAAAGRIQRDDWRGVLLVGENPGGPLSNYLGDLFIEKKRDPKKYPDYNPAEYHFIPSALEDNPNVDKRYVSFLSQIAPEKREMYRYGRRDIFPGQFFKTFKADDRIQRLDVTRRVMRLGAMHWAFQLPGLMLWAVPLPDGRLYLEGEYEFVETDAEDVANEVLEITKARKWTLRSVIGNPEVLEVQRGGTEDPFRVMRRAGLPIIRSRHQEVAGWQRVQQWMKRLRKPDQAADDASTVPALIVSPDCEIFIATVPQLLQDDTDRENVLAVDSAHAARAFKNLVMSRPAVTLLPTVEAPRDLSQFDAKTRRDIEREGRNSERRESDDIANDDPSSPWGDFDRVSNSDEPW